MKESYVPPLFHRTKKPRGTKGPRKKELSQGHLLGRGEVPSARGLGVSDLEARTKTHGGVAECLYTSPWEPQK